MQLSASQNGTPIGIDQNAIGVVGGMGPMAGIDLVRAVFEETDAKRDQEHLPVALLSYPGQIPDRSAWLANPHAPNPVPPILDVLRRLEAVGCTVAGIPCNTAHAPRIYDAIHKQLQNEGQAIRLIHIVEAIIENLTEEAPAARKIGILATNASIESRLHQDGLERADFEAVCPSTPEQSDVQETIFHPEWGLKATARPSPPARKILLKTIESLAKQGADAVILGCTELPLAVPESGHVGIPLVSSTRALARALIRATFPEKLRPVTSKQPEPASDPLSLP